MNALRIAALLTLAVFACGCGSPSRPRDELDRGQSAVSAALDNWKAGESPAKLKTLPDPVEFSEELRGTHKLTDFTVLKVDGSDPAVIRYTVSLKLTDRKGKPHELGAVYAVVLRSPVVVARDPYY